MKNWRNWVLPILGAILTIADLGFEAINPLLMSFGLPEKYLGIIKSIFGLYGLYKIAKNKSVLGNSGLLVAEDIGTPLPPKRPNNG